MTAQAHNRFVFCVVVVEFAVNGNQALQHIIDLLGDVFYIFFRFKNVSKHVMCQTNYNDLPIIRKEYQLAPTGVYSLLVNVMKDMENRIIHSRLALYYITSELTLLDLFRQCCYLCGANAIFSLSINHMVPIYSTFLFCLFLWPGQGTTTVIRQDQFS